MKTRIPVIVERGSKKAFASAVEWPGWSRGGRDETQALEALVAYGARYKSAMRAAARDLIPPPDTSAVRVVERLKGDTTTDFGVPTRGGAADERPVNEAELNRLSALLRAAWAAFDRAARAAAGVELAKGPRGGGRDLDPIIDHVLGAEESYVTAIGGRRPPDATDADARTKQIHNEVLAALAARARGEPPAPSRRTSPLWTPRYFVRRSAWHVLDHAWEIEDRAKRPG